MENQGNHELIMEVLLKGKVIKNILRKIKLKYFMGRRDFFKKLKLLLLNRL